jgi:3'-5' exonuclease
MDSIIIDIETAINEELVREVIFEGQDISLDDAYNQYKQQLLEKSGSDFMPVIFHYPITVGYAHLGGNYKIRKFGVLPRGDEGVTKFWEAVNKGFRIVSWNGRSFDMPVMEMAAFRLGIPTPDYYNAKFGARYRYSEDGHYDLYDFVTNNGAVVYRGGLNAISKMIGLTGKIGTVRGNEVHDAYKAGRIDEIDQYCLGDVMITTALYYHVEYMRGRLNQDEYQALRADCEEKLSGLQ